MRLFIAINFDEATKEAAAASAELLQQHSLRGNFSSRDNYHITLAFLGETERRRLPKVCEAMENCQGREMKLSLQCLGCFDRGDSVIAWRAVRAPRSLWTLQEQLLQELRLRGFSPDDKKFKPHLTLARQLVLAAGVSWEELNREVKEHEFTVQSMELMLSERIQGKLTYSPLFSCVFAK